MKTVCIFLIEHWTVSICSRVKQHAKTRWKKQSHQLEDLILLNVCLMENTHMIYQTLNNRTWYLRLHSKQPFLFNTLSKYSYNTSTTVDGNKFKAGGRRTHPTRCSLERAQQYGKCGEHKPCELEDRIRNLQRISYVSTSGTHPPHTHIALKNGQELGLLVSFWACLLFLSSLVSILWVDQQCFCFPLLLSFLTLDLLSSYSKSPSLCTLPRPLYQFLSCSPATHF